MGFEDTFQMGKLGESSIARWLRSRGNSVMPVYEKMIEEFKGPQLFLPKNKCLIAPDMLVFNDRNIRWIEAKKKTAFSWHRNTHAWVTGIDTRHYEDYLQVEDCSPWPVWLLFLQGKGQAKDSPPDCPSGLYANSLQYLRENVSHRFAHMTYWNIDNLRKLASLEEVEIVDINFRVLT
jgi:hypothetical protein